MIYGGEQTISLEEVVFAVKAKERQKKLGSKADTNPESLSMRGMQEKKLHKNKRSNCRQRFGK